ncbi:hypothetical protein [Streptomyces sasae]|uniref:hypothetical protein n=1 Tax=Streptomyces sasae TaxID=1266772 RepID=UPI00293016CE|nr:hypothetical protein [Streptomyces sasae]
MNPSTTPTATLTPQQVNVVRDNYGLPPITLYKGQVRVDGVSTKCLPDDRWVMLPPDRSKWGQTLYGTTAESLVLSRGGNPQITREDAPGLIITRGGQERPGAAVDQGRGRGHAHPVLPGLPHHCEGALTWDVDGQPRCTHPETNKWLILNPGDEPDEALAEVITHPGAWERDEDEDSEDGDEGGSPAGRPTATPSPALEHVRAITNGAR